MSAFFQCVGFDHGVAEGFVEFKFLAPLGGFGEVGFVEDDDGVNAGRFGCEEGTLQQGFAG